jgi:hypothetical protein
MLSFFDFHNFYIVILYSTTAVMLERVNFSPIEEGCNSLCSGHKECNGNNVGL